MTYLLEQQKKNLDEKLEKQLHKILRNNLFIMIIFLHLPEKSRRILCENLENQLYKILHRHHTQNDKQNHKKYQFLKIFSLKKASALSQRRDINR